MNFDAYMIEIAATVAINSKCKSRKIGAVLVRDKAIISTGYNGPARGVSHCGEQCPRHVEGYPSGQGLRLCPATHAEANAIAQAARSGVSTMDAWLYLVAPFAPCKTCAGMIINAGISRVIMTTMASYDNTALNILREAGVGMVEFPRHHEMSGGVNTQNLCHKVGIGVDSWNLRYVD